VNERKKEREKERKENLDTEEHGTHISEPFRVDDGDTPHVFLGGEDQLVVHHIIRRKSQTIQCGGRMQITRRTRSQIHILPDS